MYSKGDLLTPQQAQHLAVQEAQRGAGFVSPNPLVGCVVVDTQHRLLSSGFHGYYGGPHAERVAFASLSNEELSGSTVYVTLEPCSHHGKTPPCAELLIGKNIYKVVVGQTDPNPLVAGRGIDLLKKENILVETNEEFSVECARLAEKFFWHIQNQTPFVALKVALSADGKIAGVPGSNPMITSEEARFYARELRATYDATLIGAETFLRDNPLLDFRGTRWEGQKNPKVVILDPRGRARAFFAESRMSKVVSHKDVSFITEVSAATLKDLYLKGIYSLYVEGGAKTHELFIQQKLFQKIICFVSPKHLGEGVPWVWSNQDLRSQFNEITDKLVGEDKCLEFYPK